jgi:hypothetical protein
MLSDIAGIEMVAVGYIELANRGRRVDEDELWKAVKLRGASRESIRNAERLCDAAMVNATTIVEDIRLPGVQS